MLNPGDTVDRYTIDAAIGAGGMGCVYRAHDSRLDRRVALKVISDGATPGDGEGRLLREARAAASLDHPNAVSIFDVGELDGAPYIVMELVSGRTLREVIVGLDGGDPHTPGPAGAEIPVATRVGWVTDVARALSAAHRRGIVHRDIKPENVMVRDDGVVKVLDFGIARRAVGQVDAGAPTQSPALPTITREGVKVGTPVYMAPEQIRGDALDGRADQFAWGVLAFELLTGKPPWRGAGEPLAVVASILTDDVSDEPLARGGVPAPVRAVLHRALSKKPADRFASMDDLLRALSQGGEGEPSGPRVEPPRRVAPPTPAGAGPRVAPPPAAGATALQRYSTAEVQEILARAVEQQAASRSDTRLGFDDLVAAAAEVGVDPEVLRQASRELRARQAVAVDEGAARDAWIRRKRRRFYRHLGVWVIVNLAFVLVGLAEHGSRPEQFLVPGLFWGMAVAIQGLRVFMTGEDEWREEREKEEKKNRKQQQRAKAIDRAIDEGVAVLLKTGDAIRQRVAAPPAMREGAAADRRRRVAGVEGPTGVRPGDTASLDAVAEEEAAAAEEGGRAQRRRR